MSLRAGLIVALFLTFALAARGDGIWSGGVVMGNDGIANRNVVGVNGIAAINAVSSGGGGGGGCAGVLDLSTGCMEIMAYGGLF